MQHRRCAGDTALDCRLIIAAAAATRMGDLSLRLNMLSPDCDRAVTYIMQWFLGPVLLCDQGIDNNQLMKIKSEA